MSQIDPLSEYLSLLRIRKRAARRSGIFLGVLFLFALLLNVLYFRLTYQVEWLVLILPVVAAISASLSLLQESKDSELSSIIELIEALQRSTDGH